MSKMQLTESHDKEAMRAFVLCSATVNDWSQKQNGLVATCGENAYERVGAIEVLQTDDLPSVEVFRGSQNMSYGRNSGDRCCFFYSFAQGSPSEKELVFGHTV